MPVKEELGKKEVSARRSGRGGGEFGHGSGRGRRWSCQCRFLTRQNGHNSPFSCEANRANDQSNGGMYRKIDGGAESSGGDYGAQSWGGREAREAP